MAKATPVISVDTKKKELLGNYDNGGRQWLPAKQPVKVNGHDFPSPDVPRAYPYGVYDVDRNTGFVNVGTNHDPALSPSHPFAVGGAPKAASCIPRRGTCSSGRWRRQQRLAVAAVETGIAEVGATKRVWPLPFAISAGTSKWNKIEHRLFSFISSNWRGEPLRDYETIVQLIARTTTAKGLKVTCRLDRREYPTGRKVTVEEMQRVNLERSKFHGEWNYTIRPRST